MAICLWRLKRGSSTPVNYELQVYTMQNLRSIEPSIMPTMLLANLNAGVLMIAKNGVDWVLQKPPLERLSQNFLSTIYLSRVKLDLGALRKSRMFRRYLIQQNLDIALKQADRFWLVCRELLQPLEKVSNP